MSAAPSAVRLLDGQHVNDRAPIFDSLREDYPRFDTWWAQKVAGQRRPVLLTGTRHAPTGVAVLKLEPAGSYGLGGPLLKICTFKVARAAPGAGLGSALIGAAVRYARERRCAASYLEVRPDKVDLTSWLPTVGFTIVDGARSASGDSVWHHRLP